MAHLDLKNSAYVACIYRLTMQDIKIVPWIKYYIQTDNQKNKKNDMKRKTIMWTNTIKTECSCRLGPYPYTYELVYIIWKKGKIKWKKSMNHIRQNKWNMSSGKAIFMQF